MEELRQQLQNYQIYCQTRSQVFKLEHLLAYFKMLAIF